LMVGPARPTTAGALLDKFENCCGRAACLRCLAQRLLGPQCLQMERTHLRRKQMGSMHNTAAKAMAGAPI